MPSSLRHLVNLILLCLLCLTGPSALGQTYSSILVFGDSLSDSGNVAHLTGNGIPPVR